MDPQGSNQHKMTTVRRGWLAHVPLWVIMGLGVVVMVATEAPEAARVDYERSAIGEISTWSAASAPISASSPFTLTDLGVVPDEALIRPDHHSLVLVNWGGTEEPLIDNLSSLDIASSKAMVGLPALRHSFERRQQLANAPVSDAPISDAPVSRETVQLTKPKDVAESGPTEPLLANLDGLSHQGENAATPALPHSLKPDASSEAEAGAETNPTPAAPVIGIRAQQQHISRFLARYYRRSEADIRKYVRYAFDSAKRNSVDPLLVIAIMSIESSLNPKARSHKGAKGLMQVLVAAHTKRFKQFGGVKAAYNPRVSIEVGTRIIAGMIVRTGTVEGALKHYVGAANFRTDGGYGAKVIGMRERVWASATRQSIPSEPDTKVATVRANLAQASLTPLIETARR